jgi:hypothetical protein
MKIAVLFGGWSEERAVSIASAAKIIPALPLPQAALAVGIAFPALLERICQGAIAASKKSSSL